MLDRLRYETCYFLWKWWHMRLRDYYGHDNHGKSWMLRSRPWHHLCCNGDNGGWRTRICDRLERGWRYTRHYELGG